MSNNKNKKSFFSAISIIIGTAVGAGIFGIPFAISRIGFLKGLIYFFVLIIFIVISSLCYSEVVLRTKKRMYFPGYAQKYLGSWGKIIGIFVIIFGIYSALTAYIIGVGNFLFNVFYPYFGGTRIIYGLLFFVFCSLILIFSLKTIISIEKLMVFLVIFIIIILFIFGLNKFEVSNLLTNPAASSRDYFLPYGVILFALAASSSIPEAEVLLGKNKKRLKNVIIIGLVVPLIIYVLFTLTVLGVSGVNTSQNAISGLEPFLGINIVRIGSILGVLTMTTSFLSLGVVLKDCYRFDFKIPKIFSWLLVISIPFIIFILQLFSFVEILSVAGTIMGGIEGILIILMFQRAKKFGEEKPPYNLKFPKIILYTMAGIFFLGIIYQIIMLF